MEKINHKKHTRAYNQRILHILQQKSATGYTLTQIYTKLKVKTHDKTQVKQSLTELCQQQLIKKISKNRYIYNTKITHIGKVDYVHKSYAYILVPGEKKDIFVLQKNLLSALHNDLVKVEVLNLSYHKRPEGKVIEIIQRNTEPIIGKIITTHPQIQALVEQKQLSYRVILEDDPMLKLEKHDKVILTLNLLPNQAQQFTGKVIKRLGQSGVHEVEMQAIMAEFNLQDKFSLKVLQCLNYLPTHIPVEEIQNRKDFRNIPTCTIDPENAQDFDDALSYQILDNGNHQVGVHIADVSYYVQPNTPLDQEAYDRNTSVYLVDRCIPMLPELISNQLCSLRPKEDKLAVSAIFELNPQGKVLQRWFGLTIIQSQKRFTYQEAQAILDTKQGPFYPMLNQLNKLAKHLNKQRLNQGAIQVETKEFVFELDSQSKPLAIHTKLRSDTHKLIEEFMLLANKEVATYIANLKPSKDKKRPTFIYRSHDKPNQEKLTQFLEFVKQLGYPIKTKGQPFYKIMQYLEQAIQGSTKENIIQSLAIRTMAKALYTTKPDPHFALAFKHYCHFTSPIRRYPDLVVHRLLKSYLQGEKPYGDTDYEKICKQAIEREYIATCAERASIKYKQVEFIQNLPDQTWKGIISGITEWNLYVEILDNACEGMIKLADMTDDFYIWDEKHSQIIGKQSKKCYRLGDLVTVKVKHCHLNKRYIDFILV